MEPVLFEKILYGELRPWSFDGTDIVGLSHGVLASELSYSVLEDLLKAHPEIKAQISNCEMAGHEPFVEVETPKPFDQITLWYNRLLELESLRCVCCVLLRLQSLEASIDRVYELNRVVRYAVDLLRACTDLQEKQQGSLSQYVLTAAERQLMRLILDLGLRYADLPGIDRYDERALYMGVLNRAVPEVVPFAKTKAYRKQELMTVLKQAKLSDRWRVLHDDILKELQKDRDQLEYQGLLVHLENAAFLVALEASFLEDYPRKLLEEGYCREWILGVRRNFVEEEDSKQASDLLEDLWSAVSRYESFFGAEYRTVGLMSEARRLIHMLDGIWGNVEQGVREGDTPEGTVVNKPEADEGRNFVESFNDRFITIDEFKEALGAGDRSVRRYLADSDIRMLEITSNLRFLYREDVEAFLEERTGD